LHRRYDIIGKAWLILYVNTSHSGLTTKPLIRRALNDLFYVTTAWYEIIVSIILFRRNDELHHRLQRFEGTAKGSGMAGHT
jgi:hypothetical protein